jgi:hypothetical protein
MIPGLEFLMVDLLRVMKAAQAIAVRFAREGTDIVIN